MTGYDESRGHNRHGIAAGQTDLLAVHDGYDRCSDQDSSNARIKRGKGGSAATVIDTPSAPRRRPSWLHDGPLTERVRLASCDRCHRAVLEALVDGAMPTRADLVRLTPAAELALLLTGGHTVRLGPPPIRTKDGRVIGAVAQCMWSRHPEHIRAAPGQGLPVHDCARQHGRPDRTLLAPAPRPSLPPGSPCPF